MLLVKDFVGPYITLQESCQKHLYKITNYQLLKIIKIMI